VNKALLLNRGDCCGDDLNGATISVCNGDVCTTCGNPIRGAKTGEWEKRYCHGEIGDSLLISAGKGFLTVCELQIGGKPAELPVIDDSEAADEEGTDEPIEIEGGDSSPPSKDAWTVDKVFDGDESVDPNKNSCYQSKALEGAWLKFAIPLTKVNRVHILNRGDCCEGDLKGATVQVCKGDDCLPCGSPIKKVVLGDYSNRFCDGIEGDNIIVNAGKGQLTVCELKVTGKQLDGGDEDVDEEDGPDVPITKVESSKPADDESTADKAVDGSDLANLDDHSCYSSQANHGAWLKAYFPEPAIIRRVWMLNRGDCCGEELVGTQVQICDGDNCVNCGNPVKKAVTGEWQARFCDGLVGDSVKILADENTLTICEIQIKGTDLSGRKLKPTAFKRVIGKRTWTGI
jgi:hypothetical protein